ncbi:hypothetical protein LS73_005225 [Helicobacter muridarum]|uniref:Periplasmic protein n=1 Tax=Helicobacter muridarum TaxID=216 RepID=A0A099TXB1_9HELI|nr:hypothetical protein [Helicobacter muridarum]TLE00208.1 hypothetical protein LS73_005225 [Helicobacter muridarum]STQ85692.1 periplasmic protein [Helicobacter muridarum]
MIKGIIIALGFVVVIAGSYSVYAFYKKLQNNDVMIEESPVIIPSNEGFITPPRIQISNNKEWIQNTEKVSKISTFQFPANVLDISIDVKKEVDIKIDPTKIVVKNLDDYKFFCLNEILRQKRVDFSYFKNENSLHLLLFIPDETKRKLLLKDFEYYDIEYEVGVKA